MEEVKGETKANTTGRNSERRKVKNDRRKGKYRRGKNIDKNKLERKERIGNECRAEKIRSVERRK